MHFAVPSAFFLHSKEKKLEWLGEEDTQYASFSCSTSLVGTPLVEEGKHITYNVFWFRSGFALFPL